MTRYENYKKWAETNPELHQLDLSIAKKYETFRRNKAKLKKYASTDKGKAARKRWKESPKGRAYAERAKERLCLG